MPTPDEQLVQQITEQVLLALQRGRHPSQPAAPIHPPVGVCTGDYSQFTDRPDLAHATDARADTAMSIRPAALTGIITAAQLQEAIENSLGQKVLISPTARLTPLATDYARENPDKIERGQASVVQSSNSSSQAASWLWWADGHCPAVQAITAAHRQRLRPSAAARSESGLLQAIRDLKIGLANQTLAGGLLFVSSAARAGLLANRCPEVRAVVGTCEQGVNEAISDLGVNVLIVEYPYVDENQMSAMVAAMLAGLPEVSPHLARELADLQRSPER